MKKIFARLWPRRSPCWDRFPPLAFDHQAMFEGMDTDYYTRFQGQDISINVYNWGSISPTARMIPSTSTPHLKN